MKKISVLISFFCISVCQIIVPAAGFRVDEPDVQTVRPEKRVYDGSFRPVGKKQRVKVDDDLRVALMQPQVLVGYEDAYIEGELQKMVQDSLSEIMVDVKSANDAGLGALAKTDDDEVKEAVQEYDLDVIKQSDLSITPKLKKTVLQTPSFPKRADDFKQAWSISYLRWQEACTQLPKNTVLSATGCQKQNAAGTIVNPVAEKKSTPLKTHSAFYKVVSKKDLTKVKVRDAEKIRDAAWQLFEQALTMCTLLYRTMLEKRESWFGCYKNLSRGVYFQKLVIAPDDNVIFFGDRHGDISSLMLSLKRLQQEGLLEKDTFRLKDDHTYLVFLGDFVDRGFYGAEVLYTVMRLKCANPNRVFIARGNHESADVTAKMGFMYEIVSKFNDATYRRYHQIAHFFKLLPAAIFIECAGKILQVCHGGIHLAYDDATFFKTPSDVMYEQTNYTENNGCMWSDFVVSKDEAGVIGNGDRGGKDACCASYAMTQDYLSQMNLQLADVGKEMVGFVRAHQHSSDFNNLMMEQLILFRGIYPLWMLDDKEFYETVIANAQDGVYVQNMGDSLVRTCNVSPDSIYGVGCKYAFDTFGVLKTAQKYDKWTMSVYWTIDLDLLKSVLTNCNNAFARIFTSHSALLLAFDRCVVPYQYVNDRECLPLLRALWRTQVSELQKLSRTTLQSAGSISV